MATVATQLNSGSGFASGEIVTATKLNSLVNTATVTGIVNADIDASAAIALSKLGTGALPTAITVASANIVDGTIVSSDLATAVANALLPAGAVMPFAMNSAPSGWLAADGSAVSRATYAALFAAIGTTHGAGDGSTTFNVPDLRGIFVRGSGSQTISGTSYSGTFATKQQDALQEHYHNVTTTYYDLVGRTSGGANTAIVTSSTTYNTTNPLGARTAAETRPANIALLYCVKF